ncbi:MAG: hypothetical protein KDK39_06835 [Leptospiraceae bacterium]|nr:hypothetical protein [Leptospiraceae bacterium]
MQKKNTITFSLAAAAAFAGQLGPQALQSLQAEPSQNQTAVTESLAQKQIGAYSNSKYTYDDAEILAQLWGLAAPWDAKLKMGSMILNGQSASIERILESRQFRAYSDSQYSYEDAESLAQLWGLESPWDAKLKMGRLILNGKPEQIDNALE